MYDSFREWLGKELNVHPKLISLVGSARLGYSLTKSPKYGSKFGKHSDLDLVVVSDSLFAKMLGSFNLFSENFMSGREPAPNARVDTIWVENVKVGSRNAEKGFLNSWIVPNYPSYPIFKHLNQTRWVAVGKFKATPSAPTPKDTSIRVYKDWVSFIDQVSLTLLHNFSSEKQ